MKTAKHWSKLPSSYPCRFLRHTRYGPEQPAHTYDPALNRRLYETPEVPLSLNYTVVKVVGLYQAR